MKKSKKQEFASRVAEANRTNLIVIMYEIILENIKEAKTAIKNKDRMALEKEMKQARSILNHLMGSLNYQYKISFELMKIYIYSDKRLSSAMYGRNTDGLDEVKAVMERLLSDFTEVAKQDHSGAVMKNTESIYTGLTYGKQNLNESVDYGNKKRGIMV